MQSVLKVSLKKGSSIPVRYSAFIVLFMILSISACKVFKQMPSDPQDRSDLSGQMIHVRGGIYVYRDFNYWQTNSVIYVGKDAVVFIDAPWNEKIADRIIWKTSAMTEKEFRALIVTDYRPHRAGGMIAFHKKSIPILYHGKTFSAIVRNWDILQSRYEAEFNSWIREEAVKPSALIGEKAELLNGEIVVLHSGDGFVQGGLAVYFPRERVLYAGSALSYPFSFSAEMNQHSYLKLLQNIKKMKIKQIIPGHGSNVTDLDIIDDIINELNEKKR